MDTDHGSPAWDPALKPFWSSCHRSLREEGGLCVLMQKTPAPGVSAKPGGQDTEGNLGDRIWRGTLGTGYGGGLGQPPWPNACPLNSLSLPHTSHWRFMFFWVLNRFFSLNIFLGKLYFYSCPARLSFSFLNLCALH